MSETCLNEVRLAPEPGFCLPEFIPEMLDALTADVLELHPLQMPPNAFIWIELGRVGRELLYLNALFSDLREERLHLLASVNGSSVPDQEELVQIAHQMSDEIDDLRALDGVFVLLGEQTPTRRYGRDGGEMVPGKRHSYNRRLSHRRVGSSERRQQVEGSLVREHNCPSLRYALSLR